ncbi:aquaporin-like protein [Leptodontidium sp. MPI-SDFR-AT-0119]|nr:aquaporin-like protein [Leptodontidium sp. MPI-SDFR-AT-0119]
MNINKPRRGARIVLPSFSRKGPSTKSRTSSLKSNPHIQARNHLVATIAKFAGTTLFLLFAFAGTQVALNAHPSEKSKVGATSHVDQLLYISLCFGFSLTVNSWIFFRISGGLFNPAVSLGMCLVGALPYTRGALLTIAQILGGITAAAILSTFLPGPLTVQTELGGGTSIIQGLFIEMFLSALLVFTIFMLAAEKHKGTFIAPIGIGLSLFIAELMGVYFTGGSVNSARSFGPAVIGPILGAIVASGVYLLMKILEYETANPGQDSMKPEGEHFNPDLDTSALKVSFAPSDYVAAEEGRSHGVSLEYGAQSRHFSDSLAPAHTEDQYRGLGNGGMHGNDTIASVHTSGGSSDLRRFLRRAENGP